MPYPFVCNNCGKQFSGLVPVYRCYECQSDDISAGDMAVIPNYRPKEPESLGNVEIANPSETMLPVAERIIRQDRYCIMCGSEIPKGAVFCG